VASPRQKERSGLHFAMQKEAKPRQIAHFILHFALAKRGGATRFA
jgi:hypothetical protein